MCGFQLDDEAIMTLGKAWPNLQILHLGTHFGWGRKGISLKALVSLIDNCPDLNTLNVVIDGVLVKDYSLDRPGGPKGIHNEAINSLTIGDSRIQKKVALVAAFLSDILPNVDEISAWKSIQLEGRADARKYRKRWNEVANLIGMFAMVRYQERMARDDGTEEGEDSPHEDVESTAEESTDEEGSVQDELEGSAGDGVITDDDEETDSSGF